MRRFHAAFKWVTSLCKSGVLKCNVSDFAVQGDVLLTFTPEATGVSWPAYVDLYCAGAKQLFFHEKPKVHLQLEPVTMSSL